MPIIELTSADEYGYSLHMKELIEIKGKGLKIEFEAGRGFAKEKKTKMRKLLSLCFWMYLFPLSIFAIHPLVLEGNNLYKEKNYQKAFEKFYDYLFDLALVGPRADYYIALIGAISCIRHNSPEIYFDYHKSKWNYLMAIHEYFPEEKEMELAHIVNNSIFLEVSRNN